MTQEHGDAMEPFRGGDPWEAHEQEELIQRIAVGMDLEELASLHGRSKGAITARIKQLAPSDAPGGKRLLPYFKDLLDQGFDWESELSVKSNLAGRHYWSTRDDQLLRDGWEDRTPLSDLVRQVFVGEMQIVKRLIALGVASSTVEVTDRLPFDPSGVAAMRRRLALEGASAQVYVALVWIRNNPLHVSVHPSKEAALQLVQQIDDERPREVTDWQVALRWPGSGDAGKTWDPTGEHGGTDEEPNRD